MKKKICLVVVSAVTMVVATTGPAAAATHRPAVPAGVFCKIFPLLCK